MSIVTDSFAIPELDDLQPSYRFIQEQNLKPHVLTFCSLYGTIPEAVTGWVREYLKVDGWGYYWDFLLWSVLLEVVPVVAKNPVALFGPDAKYTPRGYLVHLLENEPSTVVPITTALLGLFSDFYKGGRPLFLKSTKFPGFTRLEDL